MPTLDGRPCKHAAALYSMPPRTQVRRERSGTRSRREERERRAEPERAVSASVRDFVCGPSVCCRTLTRARSGTGTVRTSATGGLGTAGRSCSRDSRGGNMGVQDRWSWRLGAKTMARGVRAHQVVVVVEAASGIEVERSRARRSVRWLLSPDPCAPIYIKWSVRGTGFCVAGCAVRT